MHNSKALPDEQEARQAGRPALRSWWLVLVVWMVVARGSRAEPGPERSHPDLTTHRLLPGIVGRGIADSNWTRTQHDALASGFSPLVCGMKRAPAVWQELRLPGGAVNLCAVVAGPPGQSRVLVDDGRLRLVTGEGHIVWTRPSEGSLIQAGDLRCDGGQYGLFAAGPRLSLLDLGTGENLWQHLFEPSYVGVRAVVADILPDAPGLEAAVVLAHGEEACLVRFPPRSLPVIEWQRRVVDGDFNERYDHHNATIQLDLSQPEQPVVWNLRRHRCRGLDARSGAALSSISYDIGGAERRNYGPMNLARGRDGQLLACVFGERVQVHCHAIRLHRDRDNELAWQHYYGEVYKEAPGVALESHGLVDLEGDGRDEMLYSVRDPAKLFQSIVRMRAADTGEIRFELPDHWGVAAFENIGPERISGFLALEAPDGQTPRRGRLKVFRFNGTAVPECVGELESAGMWGPLLVAGPDGTELMLREEHPSQGPCVSRLIVAAGKLTRTAVTSARPFLASPVLTVLPDGQSGTSQWLFRSEGELQALTWEGNRAWSVPLEGGAAPAVSAADLDGDGRAEVVAAADRRLLVVSCDDDHGLTLRKDFQHEIAWHNHHPVICDLNRDGQLDLLAAGTDETGNLVIRAHRPDGMTLWETPLGIAVEDLRGVIFNAGEFLPGARIGIAVSVTDDRLVHEGTYLLDGSTGEVRWFKGMYRDGLIVMPYRPNGIPIAYDLDQDGVEEIEMDLLSYMAFLRGTDGEFVLVRPTKNIGGDTTIFAGHLYNTFCPVWKAPGDARPHWFVTAGFGPFGMMHPDPGTGIWKEDLDYDVPSNIALVDVDGDGILEAGYVAQGDTTFMCRDAWTGEVEWTLELPSAPNATTITADFDGDGRGEYFCGMYCIGVDASGAGELRWRSPVHFYWPVVADFDGDGLGEIAGGTAGRIVVLNGE